MRHRIYAVPLLLATASLLHGANVFTVTAASGFSFSDTAQAVAFRTTTFYRDVTISMPLKDNSSGGPIGGTEGTAYLVNAIGASATAANEAAPPVTISGLSGTFASRTLWSGITLPPGTYYVVLVAAVNTPFGSPSLSAEAGSSGSMVVTTGAGVSDVGARVTSTAIASFPPASDFGGFNPPSQIFITVTGTATSGLFTVTAPAGFSFSDTAQAVAFRTTTYYANVTISMPLLDNSSGGPIGGTEGTAYLVNAIGAGATAANEAAPPVTISGLSGTFASRTLWSGISLPPGTYYVVLVAAVNTPFGSPSLSAQAGSAGSMVVTTGVGVSDVGARVTSAIASFPPASNFGGFNPPSQIFITVTGTPISPLFTVTAPAGFSFSDTAQAVAFRTTITYTNVTISMPLLDNSSGGPIGGTEGTAYLVNAIGAGTTAANEVAPPVTITGLTGQFAPVTLWSGITLPPGTYYIVLVAAANTDPPGSPSSSGEAGSSGSMVVITGVGVSDVGARVTSAIASFPPASNFGGFNPPSQIFVLVSGDPAAPSVPAMSQWALAILALLLMGAAARLLARIDWGAPTPGAGA